jgi:O-antigen/teichoic acid export membrane protein
MGLGESKTICHAEVRTIFEQIKRLSKDILIYGTGNTLVPLINIVTLPILTRFFDPSRFGVIEGIVAISSVFALFSTLMLESAAQRSFFDYKEEEEFKRKRIISTSFWALMAWNILFFMPILLNSERIGSLFIADRQYDMLLFISLATVPIISLFKFLREIFRLRNQPGKYTVYTVVSALLLAGLVILFVAIMKIGLAGYFLGALIGGVIVLPFVTWSVRENILFVFSWDELKKMLHYALPLIPTSCSIWVLTLSDRFFLLRLTSLREVGLYAIGVKLTQVIFLFVAAFGLAWSPFIFSIYSRDKDEEKRVRGKVTTYYIFALAFLAVFITVFSRPFILLFTTNEYLSAYKVIGILALATAASGASQVLCTGINLSRKTKFLAVYTGLAALSNIILNAILIPKFGFIGAAVATAISYYFLCILFYKKSQQLYLSPYEPEKIIKIGIVSCVLVLAGTFFHNSALSLEILTKTLLLFSFPFLCFLCKVFDPNEIQALKKGLQDIVRYGMAFRS